MEFRHSTGLVFVAFMFADGLSDICLIFSTLVNSILTRLR